MASVQLKIGYRFISLLAIKVSILTILQISHCLKVIPDDYLTTCEDKTLKAGEIFSGNFADVNITFDLQNDNKMKIIGGITFKTEVKTPLFVLITGEKLIQGEFQKKLTKTVVDGCFDLYNPTDIFYSYFKDKPKCPLQPGVSYILKLVYFFKYRQMCMIIWS